jgi:nucleoside-diphosphate-sugar epimerase
LVFCFVLTNVSGGAWVTKEIKVLSDGSPWRPLVHALDIGSAIRQVLSAPRDAVHGEVFNVGSSDQNYRVRDIADAVGNVFTGCSVTYGERSEDNRSYRVSFDKLHTAFPDFTCEWSAESGARQLYELFARIDLSAEDFEAPPYTRLKQIEWLLRTGQLDDDFFWRSA